jgi:sortase A
MTIHVAKHGAFARRLIRLISSALIVGGFAALAYVAYVGASARYFQKTEAAKFSKSANAGPVSPTPTVVRRPMKVSDGDVIGMIEIQSVGIRAVVLQGDSSNVLRRAVGHVPTTPLPGEPGNIALAAHRDTIFRPLQKIKTGDEIDLRTATGVVQYRVRSTAIVGPSDVRVLESRGRNELTLVTCYPFYYVGNAPERFVVRAEETVPFLK